MSVILPLARIDDWLTPDAPISVIAALLAPAADDQLRVWPVSTVVNGVRNDGPHLLRPIDGGTDEARLDVGAALPVYDRGVNAALSDLDGGQLVELPIDRLALAVLHHLEASQAWSLHNFLVEQRPRYRGDGPQKALIEAINWLQGSGLIARGHPSQSAGEAFIITRLGHKVLAEGLAPLDAARRLGLDLHPRLARVQSQFLLGEYELAAFAAMREVEIRVRELSGFDASLLGVKLMRRAFGEGGPLADPGLDDGERVGIMELFAGAIGTYKNPPSHRQVDYADPIVASEVVLLADLLMRMLDRTEERIARPG